VSGEALNLENYALEFLAKRLNCDAIAWAVRMSIFRDNCSFLMFSYNPSKKVLRRHLFLNGLWAHDLVNDDVMKRLLGGVDAELKQDSNGCIKVRTEVRNEGDNLINVKVYDGNNLCRLVHEWVIKGDLFINPPTAQWQSWAEKDKMDLSQMNVAPMDYGLWKIGGFGFRDQGIEMAEYKKIEVYLL